MVTAGRLRPAPVRQKKAGGGLGSPGKAGLSDTEGPTR